MQVKGRLLGIGIMSFIIVFSFIHLGVGAGIVSRNSNYGNMYRPETGLSAFNIVISIYGLLVGGFGLFAVLTDRGTLSVIVGVTSFVLGILAIASLITALVVHACSVTYVGSRIVDYMNQYQSNPTATTVIDKIQRKYQCCGKNLWIDWAGMSLGATSGNSSAGTTLATTLGIGNGTTSAGGALGTTLSTGNVTTPTSGALGTTLSTGNGTTSTSGLGSTPGTGSSTTLSTGSGMATTTGSGTTPGTQSSTSTSGTSSSSSAATNNTRKRRSASFLSPPVGAIRQKRQSTFINGNIQGLPTTFSVNLPMSCCPNGGTTGNSSVSMYCVSNSSINFYTSGCLRSAANYAIGPSMGIAVINSFMIVLAFVAIPIMAHVYPDNFSRNRSYDNEALHQQNPTSNQYATSFAPNAYTNTYGATS